MVNRKKKYKQKQNQNAPQELLNQSSWSGECCTDLHGLDQSAGVDSFDLPHRRLASVKGAAGEHNVIATLRQGLGRLKTETTVGPRHYHDTPRHLSKPVNSNTDWVESYGVYKGTKRVLALVWIFTSYVFISFLVNVAALATDLYLKS